SPEASFSHLWSETGRTPRRPPPSAPLSLGRLSCFEEEDRVQLFSQSARTPSVRRLPWFLDGMRAEARPRTPGPVAAPSGRVRRSKVGGDRPGIALSVPTEHELDGDPALPGAQ